MRLLRTSMKFIQNGKPLSYHYGRSTFTVRFQAKDRFIVTEKLLFVKIVRVMDYSQTIDHLLNTLNLGSNR